MQDLLPDDANALVRAVTWMFAALNTVDKPILPREVAKLVEHDKAWYEEGITERRRSLTIG